MIEKNGKLYARVSDIICPFADYGNVDPLVLANKARIGTEVHKAINDEINDEFPIMAKDCEGYFNSYLRWKETVKPKFLRTEERFFCDKLRITGQIDALICFPTFDGVQFLLDFKTSVKENTTTWPMQAHLYKYLLSESGIETDSALFIKLNRWGSKCEETYYSYDQAIMDKCFEAVESFWRKLEKA
jgi:hypothetical protein